MNLALLQVQYAIFDKEYSAARSAQKPLGIPNKRTR